jgi:hypothetical protein
MPSIKKRVTGFIRQLSTPGGGAANAGGTDNAKQAAKAGCSKSNGEPYSGAKSSKRSAPPDDFIQKYLINGQCHDPGPAIQSGKTGHDLPVYNVSRLDLDVFAAFTGPDGGLTSICRTEEQARAAEASERATEDTEDYDFIDLDGMQQASSRRSSRKGFGDDKLTNLDDKAVINDSGKGKEK